ncbi:hypothetical protein JG537_08945 [Streptococcus sp. SL1232]|uniref:hypothetical protein n=1 Tax=Streptococcus vicugnae TaxID=2740579 RepID=UPI0018F5F4A4|nr:hypothetical protein [Streptococcus vicugnae]MBJ7541828.1 hypothetical protein [Streptococcus vicugnae]
MLRFNNVPLGEKRIVNFSYTFENGAMYIVYSNEVDLLISLSESLSFYNNLDYGEIIFSETGINKFRENNWKEIITNIDDSQNPFSFLTPMDYFRIFFEDTKECLEVLLSLGFDVDKVNLNINDLQEVEKKQLQLVEAYTRKTEIILLDRFLDNVSGEEQNILLLNIKTLFQFTKSIVIIISGSDEWNLSGFTVVNI